MLDIVKFWREFVPREGNNIHPMDEEYLFGKGKSKKCSTIKISHSIENKPEHPHTFRLGLLPQPYMGDIENSRIVLVMLNPGFAGNEYEEHRDPISKEAILNTIYQRFDGHLSNSRYMYLNHVFSETAGYKYLCNEKRKGQEKGIIRDCIDEFSVTLSISKINAEKFVSNNICMIEPIPYHSEKFGSMTKCLQGLPSFLKAKEYLEEKVKDERNKMFIVRRERLYYESCFASSNVERFVNGEGHSAFFTLEKHGGKLLESLSACFDR
ncbi:MAG: hypothetical protein WC383_11645 [Gammaproteobacteria bacterium]|jgi:hypothetical protein